MIDRVACWLPSSGQASHSRAQAVIAQTLENAALPDAVRAGTAVHRRRRSEMCWLGERRAGCRGSLVLSFTYPLERPGRDRAANGETLPARHGHLKGR